MVRRGLCGQYHGATVLSHLYRPLLVDRYTIAASPAFCLLIAQGSAGFRGLGYSGRTYAQALVVVLAAALLAVSNAGYFGAVTKQPWKGCRLRRRAWLGWGSRHALWRLSLYPSTTILTELT
jgi:hypothetical protein